MNTHELEQFLLSARTKTYAGSGPKIAPLLTDSNQLEFVESDLLYRDVYIIGNGLFNSIETIYEGDLAVWSMSYLGDFSILNEEQADALLRPSLIDLWQSTRLYHTSYRRYTAATHTRVTGKGA